jgi:hypothetical protein
VQLTPLQIDKLTYRVKVLSEISYSPCLISHYGIYKNTVRGGKRGNQHKSLIAVCWKKFHPIFNRIASLNLAQSCTTIHRMKTSGNEIGLGEKNNHARDIFGRAPAAEWDCFGNFFSDLGAVFLRG